MVPTDRGSTNRGWLYSQTSLIRSSLIRIPRHLEENRWLPIYSICHAYIQYVCSIIRFPRPSGYFRGKRMCAAMRGLTVVRSLFANTVSSALLHAVNEQHVCTCIRVAQCTAHYTTVPCMRVELCMHCTVYRACVFRPRTFTRRWARKRDKSVDTGHLGAYAGSGSYTGWALIRAFTAVCTCSSRSLTHMCFSSCCLF